MINMQPEQKIKGVAVTLKRIRKKKGLTQADLAERTGLKQQAISKIESGKTSPSLLAFMKYCEGVGVDLFQILINIMVRTPDLKKIEDED